MPSRFIESAALSLARTGMTHLGKMVHLADATRLALADLVGFLAEIDDCTKRSERVVVALAPLEENVTTVPIAQRLDCALLCVLRGHSDSGATRKTIREIGTHIFLGSVMFEGAE